jgi:hypothetical protein
MLLLDVVAWLDPNEIEKCCLVGKLWKATLENYPDFLPNKRQVSGMRWTRKRAIKVGGYKYRVKFFCSKITSFRQFPITTR